MSYELPDMLPTIVKEKGVYQHERTKGIYVVLLISKDVKTKEELVTYKNVVSEEIWTRTLAEFQTEGKFKLIQP
jgi:hypothetical protein